MKGYLDSQVKEKKVQQLESRERKKYEDSRVIKQDMDWHEKVKRDEIELKNKVDH